VHFQQAVVVDPKSHYATDQEMVTVTGYDPHPITRQVSLTFYPGIRALRLVQPAQGIRVVRLISSSGDSYTRPVAPVAQRQLAPEPLAVQEAPWEHHPMAHPEHTSGPGAGAPVSQDAPQAHVLAAAVEGTLSESGSRPFRAVLIGDSDFASNSFFPYMANSDLALAMVRWLVREEHATPIASRIPVPSLILLTTRQMQGIFLVIVVIVPFAVVALGSLVWWRRR
jgi:ABC-type uncharacterized transport system involved in gliding motility auxiliary subunit